MASISKYIRGADQVKAIFAVKSYIHSSLGIFEEIKGKWSFPINITIGRDYCSCRDEDGEVRRCREGDKRECDSEAAMMAFTPN
jgi:hypothetical protein